MIASMFIGSLALVVAIWWYYARQRQAIESETLQSLATIAEYKVNQIAIWRRERIGDGRVQSASAIMRIARRVLSGHILLEADKADLLDDMRRLEREFGYTAAALVDGKGNIRIQSTGRPPVPSRLQEFARAALRSSDAELQDLYMDSAVGRPLMALTVPVSDRGTLIFEIDPAGFLYPYIKSWPVPSATAESHLVRREDGNTLRYLSDLRHRPGSALTLRLRLSPGLPPDQVLETGWLTKRPDYRRVMVMGVVRHVPDSPWYLVTKVDLAEIETPIRRLAWEIVLVTALIACTNIVGAALILGRQEAQIHKEREAWFYAVANDTPAYIWMASATEENSFVNRPFAMFLGLEQDNILDRWTDYLHPDDVARARAMFLECVAARCDYVAEFRLRRFDGEYRRVFSRGVPRFSPEGEFLGYAGSITDITDRREAEEKLQAANAALSTELVDRTRNETEIRSLSARLINAQEEERTRIARELHDDLNQQIGALSIAIGNLTRRIPGEEADLRIQTDRIHAALVHAAATVRRISHELHPALLEHSGLRSALEAYCAEFSLFTGIRVTFQTDGSVDGMPASVALSLYRITQEALQNIAKHAQTEQARVELRGTEGMPCLIISDDGVGMKPDNNGTPVGLGLVNIKERARLLNGSVEIWSQPGHGTKITVRIGAAKITARSGTGITC